MALDVDLGLDLARITDNGSSHLAGLKNLTSLSLRNLEAITNDGLRHLAGLKNLTSLGLDLNRITDYGLSHLAGLKNLTVSPSWVIF